MVITLVKMIDGSKLVLTREVSSVGADAKQWVDEKGQPITKSEHIKILDNAKIGEEIGGLLYESRYKIVDVQQKS